jgi:hypothetical protein
VGGPFTVSERSERHQKLSAALTPAGPVHHLEDSQPHGRARQRTPRTICGRRSRDLQLIPPRRRRLPAAQVGECW